MVHADVQLLLVRVPRQPGDVSNTFLSKSFLSIDVCVSKQMRLDAHAEKRRRENLNAQPMMSDERRGMRDGG